ncbi:alpha/beta hydrolase fold protein [Pseudomonas putida S11]|nr:alpha/beta hydrolase fold protein [Pseudomonas putida S11]
MAPLYAVGYSLGGNVLLKYLGESGVASQLQAAVAVSVPFRLDHCADRIGRGFSKVYQAHFMREMLAYVQLKQRHFHDKGQHERLATLQRLGPLVNLRTFWEFDGKVTAPLNGFSRCARLLPPLIEPFLPRPEPHADADHPLQR